MTDGLLVELRLLEGPNLYFPRPAAKVTLDVRAVEELPEPQAVQAARVLGLAAAAPGRSGTRIRQSFVRRLVRVTTRRLVAASNVKRLAVRLRSGAQPHHLVLAYPWRGADRAEAFAHAVVEVLDAVLHTVTDPATGETGTGAVETDTVTAAPPDPEVRVAAVIDAAGSTIAATAPGREPIAVQPQIPIACVTGTNGKTSTTRLLAHLAMTAGYRTGWSSTDGVLVQGELVEAGDYSGPAGGRTVLAAPGVQYGILETARGGMLLRGMGVLSTDVSVVTNVSADHLGLQGVDTLDQLAEVKAIITRVTRRTGWTVLNGDDPRVLAMRAGSPGRPFIFSLDPDSPSLREALDNGGRAITVMDGWIVVLRPGHDPSPLVEVVDVPVTLAGLSRHNLANALAATAAGLGLGLPPQAVVDGLRTFASDPTHNPGRLNIFTLPLPGGGHCTVIVDMAHNEAGLQALLEVARGLAAPGGRVLLGLAGVGDRTAEILTAMGEIAGKGADLVRILRKEKYQRMRSAQELEALLCAGAATVGMTGIEVSASEIEGIQDLVARAGEGDAVAVMVHADRDGAYDWLAGHGGTVDTPDDIRAKVIAAHAGNGWTDA